MQSLAYPAHHSTRESRALELYRAHRRDIERSEADPDIYLVPSQDGKRTYQVDYYNETCHCPDHNFHPALACEHIMAVGILRAKRRGVTLRALEVLEDEYRHALMDDDERQELRDRVLALRRRLSR